MAKFYRKLMWVQIGLLLMMFGIPKLFAEDIQLQKVLTPYSLEYTVIAKDDEVGTASRKLEPLTNGQWQLSMQSEVEYYIFNAKQTATSRFDVINDAIKPAQYKRISETSFKDNTLIQQFNWQNGFEQGSSKGNAWKIKLPENALDQLSQVLSIRTQLLKQKPLEPITISYRGGIRKNNFKVIGQETLNLPVGEVKTAIVQLEEKGRNRKTTYWFALENNMLPVQIQRIKKGKEEARLVLKTW